jgi:glycosyltransferase involved in cell wall biosynthesis
LATNTHRALKNDFTLCPNVYLLGKAEVNIPFIFKPFLKNMDSGEFQLPKLTTNNRLEINPSIISKNNSIIYLVFSKLVTIFDLNYLFFRINLSAEFVEWIKKIKPDIIYTQLGHLEFIQFTMEVKTKLEVPLVIHIMDDWIENSARGLLKKYWQNKIRNSFFNLLNKIDLLICISDYMCIEYEKRYNKKCLTFHNPISVEKFTLHNSKYNFIKSEQTFIICYTGRVGFSNENGIMNMSKAVEDLRIEGMNICFEIYTPDYLTIKNRITYKSTTISKPIAHNEIANILSHSHLLFLPLDFNKKSIKYARLSFPTKASEYMASGKPILLNAHKDMAVTKHAEKHRWAIIVYNDKIESLKKVISEFYNNNNIEYEITTNAYKYAKDNFDINEVSNKFLDALQKLIFRKNYV